jgi:membrane peptidoglycan carboxypeptidase
MPKLAPKLSRQRKVKHRSKAAASGVSGVSKPRTVKPKGLAKLAPKNILAWAKTKKGKRTTLGSVAIFLGIMLLLFLWFSKDLPSPNKINARLNAQTTKIYASDEKTLLLEVYGDKNRSLIEFNEMPKSIKDATVAIEDKDFYKHGAFSIQGLFRAVYYTVFKRNTQGGSTITQQYVKNALLTDERSLSRKIKELILAIEIEQLYKKDDILKLYLNEIPYGSTAYGIQAAAKTYFGKDAKDLSLSQSALLAAMPQAPSYYSPYGPNKAVLIRPEQKYITQAQADAAIKEDVLAQLVPYRPYANITAPHFVQYVREQLETEYGIKRVNEGGLKVVTTLDIEKQKIAEDAVAKGMAGVRRANGSNAALVAADPKTGEVQAMVGSYDYGDQEFGSFNAATAERQPGSSFKPIVYSTLFKKNYGAGTTLYDAITDFGGGYKPTNYTLRTYGVVSVRQALASSLNISAVKSLYLAGLDNSLQTAKDLGITTLDAKNDYGLSLTLGSGEVRLTEMVEAYSTFATEGTHKDQISIRKVTDSSGKVLQDNKPTDNKGKQALDPQIAYLISNILSDNGARCSLGTFPCNNPLTLAGRPVAAKTGTTNDFKDAWTMGYTPSVALGVWAGNNDNRPMNQASSIVAAPIWQTYMTAVTKGTAVEQFKRPSGIKEVTLDANTGKAPSPGTKKTRTDIFPAWYQVPQPSSDQQAKIDKVSGKLATECTPADAIETISAGLITAEVPPTDISYARWQPPVAAIAASLGMSGGSIPTEKDNVHSCSDIKPAVAVSTDKSSGANFTITAVVSSGTHTANKLIFYMDGAEIANQNIGGSGSYSIDYSPSSTGSHQFSVKVIDAALYSAGSNTVNVTASAAPNVSLNCAVASCSGVVTGASNPVFMKLYYNDVGQATKSGSSNSWPGWSAGTAVKLVVTDANGTYNKFFP